MVVFCFFVLFIVFVLLMISNENKFGDFDLYFESFFGKQIELMMVEIEEINYRNYMIESVLKIEEVMEFESKSIKEDLFVNIG